MEMNSTENDAGGAPEKELVELAKELRPEHERTAELGLAPDELAFYDAIADNPSAFELGDDTLKRIAHELVEIVRRERAWNEEAARKQLVKFFEAWGMTDPMTLYGRRKLSSVLFS